MNTRKAKFVAQIASSHVTQLIYIPKAIRKLVNLKKGDSVVVEIEVVEDAASTPAQSP